MDNTIQDYEKMVKRPGKFEGEQRYVPYFFDCVMNGDGDIDDLDENVTNIEITKEDAVIFPELNGLIGRHISLWFREDGFIQEI